jgi:hypothetical protein
MLATAAWLVATSLLTLTAAERPRDVSALAGEAVTLGGRLISPPCILSLDTTHSLRRVWAGGCQWGVSVVQVMKSKLPSYFLPTGILARWKHGGCT